MKRLFSTKTSDAAFSFATLILRVGAGSIILVSHGMDKLLHFSDKASRFADPFNIGSAASLSMVVFAEFFCAVFVILGLFTRLACIPLIIAMATALFYSHNGQVFTEGKTATLFLICFLTLLFTGPGKVSLDRFVAK